MIDGYRSGREQIAQNFLAYFERDVEYRDVSRGMTVGSSRRDVRVYKSMGAFPAMPWYMFWLIAGDAPGILFTQAVLACGTLCRSRLVKGTYIISGIWVETAFVFEYTVWFVTHRENTLPCYICQSSL